VRKFILIAALGVIAIAAVPVIAGFYFGFLRASRDAASKGSTTAPVAPPATAPVSAPRKTAIPYSDARPALEEA
jgi:hypothetical protein